MDEQIKKILIQIEEAGYEAYVIGGYVRDFLLGRKSNDIDICTNAKPKEISAIFDIPITKDIPYGSFKIRTYKYNFDITTYRTEGSYEKRRPTDVTYIKDLEQDVIRRDFTINSLCMNKDGKIIDLLGASKDVFAREIKVIGDVEKKLEEDPLRILRAVRFATKLDFKLEKSLYVFIKTHASLVSNLTFSRRKDELNIILSSSNALKGLKLLKDLGLLEHLEIKYDKIKYISDVSGMWAQLTYSDKYPFTRQQQQTIKDLREILALKKINNAVLYKYDLYVSMVAGNILGYTNKKINEMYRYLPIYSKNEIEFKYKDLIEQFNNIKKENIKIIFNEIEVLIINNKLKNTKEDIIKYINENKWKWLNEK